MSKRVSEFTHTRGCVRIKAIGPKSCQNSKILNAKLLLQSLELQNFCQNSKFHAKMSKQVPEFTYTRGRVRIKAFGLAKGVRIQNFYNNFDLSCRASAMLFFFFIHPFLKTLDMSSMANPCQNQFLQEIELSKCSWILEHCIVISYRS